MAISATTQWWVWDTGATDNGGGYDSALGGTNYARQASPQLTVADGSTNVGNTTLTSVTGGFTAQMAGNVLSISQGGIFRGYWLITAWVSNTQVTLDRNGPVTAANCTVKVGGALKFTNNGFGPQSTSTTSAVVAGQHIWVKVGTYTPSTNDVTLGSGGVAGATNNPIIMEGYFATEGDITANPTLTRPTLTPTGGAQIPLLVDGPYFIVRGIDARSTTTIQAAIQFGTGARDCVVENCIARGGASSACVNILGEKNTFRNNYVVAGATASDGIVVSGTAPHTVEYNTITCTFGNTFTGIVANTGGTIRFNRIANFTFGILLTSGTYSDFTIEQNDFYHNVNGLYFNNAAQGLMNAYVHANIFSANTVYDVRHNTADYSGLAGNAGGMAVQFDCNFFLTAGTRYSQESSGHNDITLTVSPYTDAPNGNFTLNGTTGGGATVRANTCAVANPDALNTTTLYAGSGGQPSADTGTTAGRNLWRELTGEFDPSVPTNDTVDLYINGGCQALNRRIQYHWTISAAVLTLVAETQEYTQPADCVEVHWIEWNGRRLVKSSVDEWRKNGRDYRNEASGQPKEWAHYGDKIVFLPRPNAAAVAISSAPTLRYCSTPPSVTTSGFEQLNSQDQRIPVYYGVAEWSAAHPDSLVAQGRLQHFSQKFSEEAQGIASDYSDRSTES